MTGKPITGSPLAFVLPNMAIFRKMFELGIPYSDFSEKNHIWIKCNVLISHLFRPFKNTSEFPTIPDIKRTLIKHWSGKI